MEDDKAKSMEIKLNKREAELEKLEQRILELQRKNDEIR